jgi:hypothetical protein
LQFLGRRQISGLEVGSKMRAEDMVSENNGQLVMLNTSYGIILNFDFKNNNIAYLTKTKNF